MQAYPRHGGSGEEKIDSLIIDSKNNIIVTGTYSSPFTLGVDELLDNDNDVYKTDVFVGQLDAEHEWVWAPHDGRRHCAGKPHRSTTVWARAVLDSSQHLRSLTGRHVCH